MTHHPNPYMEVGTTQFEQLAYAISLVYPWVTFPISPDRFAREVFNNLQRFYGLGEELDNASEEQLSRFLARYMDVFFDMSVREIDVDGVSVSVYKQPGQAKTKRRLLDAMQAARDGTFSDYIERRLKDKKKGKP